MSAAILLRAAQIVEQPGSWTQGATARAADGDELLRAHDADAVCWCAGGALHAASFELTGSESGHALDAAANAASRFGGFGDADIAAGAEPLDWLIGWNDEPGRRQVDVIALFRGAAKAVAS